MAADHECAEQLGVGTNGRPCPHIARVTRRRLGNVHLRRFVACSPQVDRVRMLQATVY
jgi:hypothetical protein